MVPLPEPAGSQTLRDRRGRATPRDVERLGSSLWHPAGLQLLCDPTVTRAPGLRIGYMPQRLSINPLMPISVSRFLRMSQQRRCS